jgi:hypothetical protein
MSLCTFLFLNTGTFFKEELTTLRALHDRGGSNRHWIIRTGDMGNVGSSDEELQECLGQASCRWTSLDIASLRRLFDPSYNKHDVIAVTVSGGSAPSSVDSVV